MKEVIVFLTISGLLFGCANNKMAVGQETARVFKNNTIRFDWAAIRIADSFDYIGRIQTEEVGSYRENTRDFFMITEYHYFVDKATVKPNLNRLIIVRFAKPKNPREYMSPTARLIAASGGYVSQGTAKYDDMEIPYMVQGIETLDKTSKIFLLHDNFLLNKGYTMPFLSPSYYVRQLKIVSRSVHALVMYFEPGVSSSQALDNALQFISYSKE